MAVYPEHRVVGHLPCDLCGKCCDERERIEIELGGEFKLICEPCCQAIDEAGRNADFFD